MYDPAVSAIHEPAAPNRIEDEPFDDHYRAWGYSLGYEQDADGQFVPEGGNTAIFRIFPYGMTEPVFVTKPQEDATFTVTVLSGEGELIKATSDGEVENIYLKKGTEAVIRPGEAYFYRNISQHKDLVLHDVALPAFEPDDEAKLTSSYIPERAPQPEEEQLSCAVKTSDGRTATVDLPAKFYNLVSWSMSSEKPTVEQLNSEIKFDTFMALGGLAMLAAGLYGNYSEFTGKHNGFNLLSWPTGVTSLGAGFFGIGIRSMITSFRKRAALKRIKD